MLLLQAVRQPAWRPQPRAMVLVKCRRGAARRRMIGADMSASHIPAGIADETMLMSHISAESSRILPRPRHGPAGGLRALLHEM